MSHEFEIGHISPVRRGRLIFPPEEVDKAALLEVGNSYGIELPDVAPVVCRMFGFQRATEGMQSVVHAHIEQLVATGKLSQQGLHLTVSS